MRPQPPMPNRELLTQLDGNRERLLVYDSKALSDNDNDNLPGSMPVVALPATQDLVDRINNMENRLTTYPYSADMRHHIACNAWTAAFGEDLLNLWIDSWEADTATAYVPRFDPILAQRVKLELEPGILDMALEGSPDFVRRNYLPNEIINTFEAFMGGIYDHLVELGYDVVMEYDPTDGNSKQFLEEQMPVLYRRFGYTQNEDGSYTRPESSAKVAQIILSKKPFYSFLSELTSAGSDQINDLVRAKVILPDLEDDVPLLDHIVDNDGKTLDVIRQDPEKGSAHPDYRGFAKRYFGRTQKAGFKLMPDGTIVSDETVPGLEKDSIYVLAGFRNKEGIALRGVPVEVQFQTPDMLRVDKENHHLYKVSKLTQQLCPLLSGDRYTTF